MRRGTTRVLAVAVAALTLGGCGRPAERAERREDRREDRVAETAAQPQEAAEAAEAGGWEGDAEAIESELDEIDALLAGD